MVKWLVGPVTSIKYNGERLDMDKQQMIKGLFFDFDGVITMEKQGSPTIISYISKVTNIPYETGTF